MIAYTTTMLSIIILGWFLLGVSYWYSHKKRPSAALFFSAASIGAFAASFSVTITYILTLLA